MEASDVDLFAPWHLLIVVVVLAALFGYKKLPEMSRSVARSLRVFRTEMKGLSDDDAARDAHARAQAGEVPSATPAYPPAQVSAPPTVAYPSAYPPAAPYPPPAAQPTVPPTQTPVDGVGPSAG